MIRPPRRSWTGFVCPLAALPLALSLVACTGTISAGGAGATPNPQGGGGGGSSPGGHGGTGGAPLVDNGLPGRALVRRLSNAEYDATIKTLLGDDGHYSSGFPADTVVYGFTNNTDVQDVGPALAEQYMIAAESISAKATASASQTDTLLGCKLADGDTCINAFITRFGKRAWRRPVDAIEQADLLTVFHAGRDGFDANTGVQLLLQAFLVSPNFLYRPEIGTAVSGKSYWALTSYEVASRLSYFITGSMPDDKLFAAADANTLTTTDGIAAEAKRLLATPAGRAQVGEFFGGWLDLRAVARLDRDPKQFPKWNSNLPAMLADETRNFTTSVVFDGAGDLKTLLTATYTYGDPSLAAYYGGTAGPAQNGVARIDLPASQRAGFLTQAAFLAVHSKDIQTDPVARGKFVRERIFCQGVDPPPPDLKVTAPTITPGTTTRDRFKQHEAEPVCGACHVKLDPIGLAFEHYDPIGQWRDQEQGIAIDASGDLTDTDVSGALDGVVQMAAKMAQSAEVSSCFVRNYFTFAFGRGESDADEARIGTLSKGFTSAKGRVQDLIVSLTAAPDFRYLSQETKQ